jgi:hypothetical protein
MNATTNQIGPYQIIEHTETVKPERFVVFWKVNGRVERAGHFGKRGGFRTMTEAVDAVEKTVKYGTTNV